MLRKVNYDVIDARSGEVLLKQRGKECFASYTNALIGDHKNHIIKYYMPEYYLTFHTIRNSAHPEGYYNTIRRMNDSKMPLSLEQLQEFTTWLQEFGINTQMGATESVRLDSFGYPASEGQEETMDVYVYTIDLRECQTIKEAKFALFLSRYARHEISTPVLVKAFEIAKEYPELAKWDVLLLAELIISRFHYGRTIATEYYMFSRCIHMFRYFTLEKYQAALRSHPEISNIDSFYFTEDFIFHINESLLSTEITKQLRQFYAENKNLVDLLEYWKTMKLEPKPEPVATAPRSSYRVFLSTTF